MVDWLRKLTKFKNHNERIARLSKNLTKQNGSIAEVFDRNAIDTVNTQKDECGPAWVRGTFFPPTATYPDPIFPTDVLSSPSQAPSAAYPQAENGKRKSTNTSKGSSKKRR
jgi:hypothetical protein